MGTYTNHLKLFKPAGTDLVDASTQLSRNLDIVDSKFKVVFDYQGTDVENIGTSSLDKTLYAKYYKTFNNSVVSMDEFFGSYIEEVDPRAPIPRFVNFSFLNGWNAVPSFVSPVGHFEVSDPAGIVKKVRLTGHIRLNAADAIVQGTSYTVGNIPIGSRPAVAKNYMVNCDTNDSIANVSILTTGNIVVVRFGSAQAPGAASNLISFGGIEWAI